MRSTITSRSINNTNTGGTGVSSLTINDYNLLEQPKDLIDQNLIAKFPIRDIDIYNYTITQNKMANNSIGTNQIINLSITDSKINDINGSKIFDNSINGIKLINDSISSNKIINLD